MTRAVSIILLILPLLVSRLDSAAAEPGAGEKTRLARNVEGTASPIAAPVAAAAQRRSTAPKPASRSSSTSKPPGTVREQPLMQCPSTLGNGVATQRLYCDVLAGTDPAHGLRITLPAHTGPLALWFTLHNRQTYSASEVEAGKAFARYTASVRAVGPDGAVLGHGVVQSEFRTAKDVVERIGGGAGPGGVKAVAPVGAERVTLTLPAKLATVTLLGDKLTVERLGGTESITAPGRPIAVVSQVEIEYTPTRATKR